MPTDIRAETKSWLRHGRQVARLAERVEKAYAASNRPTFYYIAVYGHLVFLRRNLSAIVRISPGSSQEALLLLRALIEAWVNLRWISLRPREYRARRFLKYYAVAQVRLLEKIPIHQRPSTYNEDLASWQRQRRLVRHLFCRRKRSKDGAERLEWDSHWASSGPSLKKSVESRLLDVVKAANLGIREVDAMLLGGIDPVEKTDLYWIYSWLSRETHAEVGAVLQRMEMTRRGLRTRATQHCESTLPLRIGAVCVLDATRLAIDAFGVAYHDEARRLAGAHERLARLSAMR